MAHLFEKRRRRNRVIVFFFRHRSAVSFLCSADHLRFCLLSFSNNLGMINAQVLFFFLFFGCCCCSFLFLSRNHNIFTKTTTTTTKKNPEPRSSLAHLREIRLYYYYYCCDCDWPCRRIRGPSFANRLTMSSANSNCCETNRTRTI